MILAHAGVEKNIKSVAGNKNVMENKREVSLLIPYKIKKGEILVYLQKRTKDAKRLPDYFGFFGGGIEEDESPEQAFRREMQEELNIIPYGYTYFKKFEFDRGVKNIFILKASDDFEKQITILEGEYGRWFSEQEIINEPKLIDEDKFVLKELCRFLLSQK